MARQTTELTGLGDIYAGGELRRRTRYRLVLTSDALDGSDGASIDGTVDLTGIGEAVVLAGTPELTLQLEDGRQLRFTLASSSGRIRVHGGLEPAG